MSVSRIAFALACATRIRWSRRQRTGACRSAERRPKTVEELFRPRADDAQAYIELTDAIASAIAGPNIDVQLGPARRAWCSKPLLERWPELAQTGRRNHMHSWNRYQRAWADQISAGRRDLSARHRLLSGA